MISRAKRFTFAVLLACTACGSSERAPPATRTAFIGLNVVDVETETVRPEQTIIIEDDTIIYVGAAEDARELIAEETGELAGAFVVPGLWDAHVHIRGGDQAIDANAAWLARYTAHGVVHVRECGTDMPGAVQAFNHAIDQGSLVGPRIHSSMRKVDGPRFGMGGWGAIRLEAPSDAGPALDELEASGAYFVKLHEASIDRDNYLAVLQEAERRGLKTAGHIPPSVSFDEALEAGLDGFEHANILLKGASRSAEELRALAEQSYQTTGEYDGVYRYQAHFERLDWSVLDESLQKMVDRGVALTPTLAPVDLSDPQALEDHAEFQYVPGVIRVSWQGRIDRAARQLAAPSRYQQAIDDLSFQLTRRAHQAGVMIMAGSDTGAYNSFRYPGAALHNELAALARAGLSPWDALRAATLHPATWLGVEDRYGSIAAGKSADLVFLNRDPTVDIGNLRGIRAVISQGRRLR
ncbi:MAG: amidohydrolase family protein [Pseudomonadota bacterium]